ncbi:sialidase family protein [Streptomyces camelliae]|uniref:Sialidase family protein n=1 Tax=Streptomyces camelliae TaxID=3004093 RepID=A0ABY7PB25_9ACTN|nr:sialidase family protein [Streptomyces sp. HUAS 2-6]WBO65463.1 sialidase family protein [Streptomyces sp. HUAS 2-6]
MMQRTASGRARRRRARLWGGLLALSAAALGFGGPSAAAQAGQDVKISDHQYVRDDGGSDPTIAACSVNKRQQNEPTTTVAPHNRQLLTAGANDYCAAATTGGSAWAGFYYSADGGQSWTDSLLPGYPTDTSAEGQASPMYQMHENQAGDPVQAWDNNGHLYYATIADNLTSNPNASLFVSRYDWTSGPKPNHRYTTLVARSTPVQDFRGLFQDKPALEVDRGADSPNAGNIYVCWTRFTGPNSPNAVYVARSTDQGRTFTTNRVTNSVTASDICDVTVTRNGSVYVSWHQLAANGLGNSSIGWVKSTDGGRSFTRPRVATSYVGWQALDQTVLPGTDPRDCGDGPLACQSGYTFARVGSQVRLAADPTSAGNPDEVFLVYDGTVPGSQTPTGTTYGTVGRGTGSQDALYFMRTGDGGATWSSPQRIDPQAKGHQFLPDIAADSGRLHVVWQDSRDDTASGPGGGDFRTVPVSNRWVSDNPPGSVSTGTGLDTYYATSSDSGGSWAVNKVSTQSTMPQYEQFTDADEPFFGDYNYIAASGPTAFLAWTDQRDTVPGTDPRYPAAEGTDGFDVHQCRTQNPDGTWGPDTCLDAGGRNQNIYGAVVG